MEAFLQQPAHDGDDPRQLGVVVWAVELFGQPGEFAQPAAVGLRQGGVGRLNGWGWGFVVSAVFRRLEHEPAKGFRFGFFFGRHAGAVGQRRAGGRRAGHHTAQQCQRAPVAHPPLALFQMRAGTHDF